MKRCGICGKSFKDDAFAQHMTRVHGWSAASPHERTSSLGRGCAIVLFAVLLIYGVGSVTIPLSGGTRGNETFYVAVGFGLLVLAGAVWWAWLRGSSRVRGPVPTATPERSIVAELIERAGKADETSTDYLPSSWLIRLDLAFRDHLWLRIAALVLGMIGVTALILIAFGTGVLR